MRSLIVLAGASLIAGCASLPENPPVAGAVGAVSGGFMLHKAGYLTAEYLAGLGVAYALYDPLAPNWDLAVTRLDEDRLRFDLKLRLLHSGGEGEARQVVLRNAERLMREQGYADFELIRFGEGVESSRPFAQRVAQAEVRLVKSRMWPQL